MALKNLLHESAADVGLNARLKSYPDGSLDVLVCDSAFFVPDGWEAEKRERKSSAKHSSPNETFVRAMRRARAQVREIALASDFSYFVTLTLNKEKVDRYDMDAITKKLNVWLDNQVRRHGLAYVLVPERHWDDAIHFHGFFNDALKAVPSGHYDKKGHEIFNLPRWTLGFTAAIRLYGEYDKAVAYVCKYIGKQGDKPGGRWYYSGGALRRPVTTYCDLLMSSVEQLPGAFTFGVPAAGRSFVGAHLTPEQAAEFLI